LPSLLPSLLQQRLGLLEVGRVKPLGAPVRVSGSTETTTSRTSTTVGEYEEQHTLPRTGVFGTDVDERGRLKHVRAMFSSIEILF
jgi:hypothetical protein